MIRGTLRVLTVMRDDGPVRRLVQEGGGAAAARVDWTHAATLKEGLEHIGSARFDVILLDAWITGTAGTGALLAVRDRAPASAIVVCTGREDREAALLAVRAGAQDMVAVDVLHPETLARAVALAVERQQRLTAVRALSLVDELTGLYNWRGFVTLARQHCQLAERHQRPLCLVYCDVDDFKRINDTYGHAAGNSALIDVAHVLRITFRNSDILARAGGDEFVVLAVESTASPQLLSSRLRVALNGLNARSNRGCRVGLSFGVSQFDPLHPCTIEDLITRADAAMYEQKRLRPTVRLAAPPAPAREAPSGEYSAMKTAPALPTAGAGGGGPQEPRA